MAFVLRAELCRIGWRVGGAGCTRESVWCRRQRWTRRRGIARTDGVHPVLVRRFDREAEAWLAWGAALFQAEGTRDLALTPKLRVPQCARQVVLDREGTAGSISRLRENSPLFERWRPAGERRRDAIGAVEPAFVRESQDGEWIDFTKRTERDRSAAAEWWGGGAGGGFADSADDVYAGVRLDLRCESAAAAGGGTGSGRATGGTGFCLDSTSRRDGRRMF